MADTDIYIKVLVVVLWLMSDTDPIWPTQTTPSQGGKLVYLHIKVLPN
jgi:hypothetical protein